MYDCVELADLFLEREMCVTCIPVINNDLNEDVAVVALEPNLPAFVALHSDDPAKRVKALVLIAEASHRMLPSRGLSFRCPSSS